MCVKSETPKGPLIEAVASGQFRITDREQALLKQQPARIKMPESSLCPLKPYPLRALCGAHRAHGVFAVRKLVLCTQGPQVVLFVKRQLK